MNIPTLDELSTRVRLHDLLRQLEKEARAEGNERFAAQVADERAQVFRWLGFWAERLDDDGKLRPGVVLP